MVVNGGYKKNHEIAKKAPALPDLSPRSKTVCFEPAGTVKQTLVFVYFFYERRTFLDIFSRMCSYWGA